MIANNSDVVPLTDAIAALRRQLREAAKQAANVPSNERFRITGVELELTVVAENSAGGGARLAGGSSRPKRMFPPRTPSRTR
ncbi:trypco2 family protein [Paraburkholderia caribensis]|uniref:trypco2 family protein n=1 Tax=Paraburkholderia caribensis TaxID=75105 RepID=UPI001D0987F8|nr:trypco2 family protein [Paraburkholderia caribensis]